MCCRNVAGCFLRAMLISALARPLQPYPISSKRIVPDQIDKPDWADDVSYLTSSYLNALYFYPI